MADYIGVITNAGVQKIAAAIGGAALNLTTVRVGDGNGAAIVPSPAMIDLVRRVGAGYPIISSGRDPANANMWRVTALIPAADGPFDIREIAVFDAAGVMIAIANHVLVEKRSPAQGAAVEITTDIVFPVASTAQVTVQIQPSAAVSVLQMLRAGFCSVESAQIANPPVNPALGATYVVAAAATGAWAGLTNRLVQWNGSVWVSIDPPPGFVVIAQDREIDHAERWLRREAVGWSSARASVSALGVVQLASDAEAAAGIDNFKALTAASARRARLALAQMLRAGFCTVESAQIAAPPANPATGATYVVAANPTGAWAGRAGQVTQWDGVAWTFAGVTDGFLVVAQDRAADHASRWLRFSAGAWVSADVSATATGPVSPSTLRRQPFNLAVVAGTANAITLTLPSTLAAYADIVGAPIRFVASATNTGPVTIAANGLAATALVWGQDLSPLRPGDLASGDVIEIVYDGTRWQMKATPSPTRLRIWNYVAVPAGGVTPTATDTATVYVLDLAVRQTFTLPAVASVPAGTWYEIYAGNLPSSYQTAYVEVAGGGSIFFANQTGPRLHLIGAGEQFRFVADGALWRAINIASPRGISLVVDGVGDSPVSVEAAAWQRLAAMSTVNGGLHFQFDSNASGAVRLRMPVGGLYRMQFNLALTGNTAAGTAAMAVSSVDPSINVVQRANSLLFGNVIFNTIGFDVKQLTTVSYLNSGTEIWLAVFGQSGLQYTPASSNFSLELIGR